MKRKKLVISRHGIALQAPDKGGSLDELIPETISRLYDNTGGSLRAYVKENKVSNETSFLRHSNKKRTKYSGLAIIAGAIGIKPKPKNQEDLDRISFQELDIQEDPRLNYSDLQFNLEAAKQEGDATYIRNWAANPNATKYKGKPITPFNKLVKRQKNCLVDAFGNMINGKNLGVIVTHAGLVEPMAMILVNSGREKPIKDFDEIGGLFDMEDYITLEIDFNEKSGLYEARLNRDNKNYKVDMNKLMA